MWLSLVERYVRDVEVAGSNPVTPTLKKSSWIRALFLLFFLAFFNERATIKQSDTFDQGLVAQLGERCVRNAEVEGSNPFRSMEQKFYKYGSIAQLG